MVILSVCSDPKRAAARSSVLQAGQISRYHCTLIARGLGAI